MRGCARPRRFSPSRSLRWGRRPIRVAVQSSGSRSRTTGRPNRSTRWRRGRCIGRRSGCRAIAPAWRAYRAGSTRRGPPRWWLTYRSRSPSLPGCTVCRRWSSPSEAGAPTRRTGSRTGRRRPWSPLVRRIAFPCGPARRGERALHRRPVALRRRRFHRGPRKAHVLVLVGAGGHEITGPEIEAAAQACPERHWHIAGPVSAGGVNVTVHGPDAPVAELLDRCSVVVGSGGGNVVAEVAAARRAFVCLPQPRPFRRAAPSSRGAGADRCGSDVQRLAGPGGVAQAAAARGGARPAWRGRCCTTAALRCASPRSSSRSRDARSGDHDRPGPSPASGAPATRRAPP